MAIVLLVDDDDVIRAALRRGLSSHLEHEIVDFNNGRSALAFAASNQVDVAVLDVDMSPLTGIDVAKALGQLDDPPDIIFLTGSRDADDELRELGPVLHKPVSFAELVAQIRAVLGQH